MTDYDDDWIECEECGGDGYHECPYCGDNGYACDECFDEGVEPCLTCDGKGGWRATTDAAASDGAPDA